jgi:hypothetical protein
MPFSFSGLFQAKPREPETVAPASKPASVAEAVVSASESQQPQQQQRAKVCAPSRCHPAEQQSHAAGHTQYVAICFECRRLHVGWTSGSSSRTMARRTGEESGKEDQGRPGSCARGVFMPNKHLLCSLGTSAQVFYQGGDWQGKLRPGLQRHR